MSLHPEVTVLPTMGAALRLVFHELRASARMIANRLLTLVIGGPFSLFYLLTELGLILLGLSIAISGRLQENLVRLALRGIMVWGLAAWILHDYLPLTQAFDGGFNVVANIILGSAHPWPAHWSPGVIEAATHSFLGAVVRLWQSLPIFQVGSAIETGWTRIGADLIVLLDAFVASFLLVIVVALLTLAYLAFAGVFFMGVALTAIGVAGQASIDKVAGPVGEALIMTAIGLAVAVPAVLGYNWLVRRNKTAMDSVRSFGADLHAVLLSAPQTPAKG